MTNPWPASERIPAGPRAVLAALHLCASSTGDLRRLTAAQWRDALDYCDRHRLTLPLRCIARDLMPPDVRQRVDANASVYRNRVQAFADLYAGLRRRLAAADLEFVALKGIPASLSLGMPIATRVQYDVDLYLPPGDASRAQELLSSAGWRPVKAMEAFPTDHLPVLLPQTDWKWRGDLFDPEMPIPIEIHFQFWAEETERLRVPGVQEFWARRQTVRIGSEEIGVLCPTDALAYACLHLLKHVFHGSVKVFHVYEIAGILEARDGDAAFWTQWAASHPPELQRLQAVVFRLAAEWFGCPVPAFVKLPEAAEAWFDAFALSPATQEFRANKDQLWLHIALLDSRWDIWSVARRRLIPGNLPPRGGPDPGGFWPGYFRYTAKRAVHHIVSLPRTGVAGLRFWWRCNGLGPRFWTVLAAAALFNFPLFVFFLHYNLFLLDLGFREDFVGLINSAQRFGGMAGTIPAAFIARRYGLRKTLLGTVLAAAFSEVLRAAIGARLPLAGLAFVSGAVFAVWAVLLAPLVAGSVEEGRRSTAFSIFFAILIGTGIVANAVGGVLPALLSSRRTVLLLTGAASALAAIPAFRMREYPKPPAGSRVYPRSRFLALYLAAFAVWHLATGLFNPLNNVYFQRLGFSDPRIGSTFAISQGFQVVAMLLSPLVIRRFGLVDGIAVMMTATAFGLVALASHPGGAAAAAAYIAYMGFQWMSEPGMNTVLMNRVEERERSGASALNYVVAFGAQALAALFGGASVTRFGYAPTLAAAAALALTAALLLRVLLRPPTGTAPA